MSWIVNSLLHNRSSSQSEGNVVGRSGGGESSMKKG